MASKKYLIYSGITPATTPIEVSVSERKEYLKCKFWKASQQEAWAFYYCYFPPSSSPSLCRLLLVLSGRLFKKKGFDEACKEAWKLSNDKLHHRLDGKLIIAPEYKKIIKAFEDQDISDSYPQSGSIDEIILWARNNSLITNNKKRLIISHIESIRNSALNHESLSEKVLFHTLNMLIQDHLITPILYFDAQALLFPNHDLLDKLKNEAYYLSNDEYFYYSTKSLIKWLMQQGYLSEKLTKKFKQLKIEAIKENIVPYEGKFSSFHKLIQKEGYHKDDLLYEAMYERPLYIKYNPDHLKHDQHNYPFTQKEIATQRYKGFGQLKRNKEDTLGQGAFGGFSVDMLLFDEEPNHFLSKENKSIPYQVELVPTEEEACYGLRPYIEIHPSEFYSKMTDEKLVFLDDFSERRDSKEAAHKEKRLRPSQEDKIACQAIAGTLWKVDPNLTIKDMAEHEYIIPYVRKYTEKTIREVWLSEVDPRSNEQKVGRPKKTLEK